MYFPKLLLSSIYCNCKLYYRAISFTCDVCLKCACPMPVWIFLNIYTKFNLNKKICGCKIHNFRTHENLRYMYFPLCFINVTLQYCDASKIYRWNCKHCRLWLDCSLILSSASSNFSPMYRRNPAKSLTFSQTFTCIWYVFQASKRRYTVYHHYWRHF